MQIGNEILQIGAGGMLAYIIIKEELNFLKKKRPASISQIVDEHDKKISKLFEYHDRCDLPEIRIKVMNNEKNIDAIRKEQSNISKTVQSINEALHELIGKIDAYFQNIEKKIDK